MLKKAASWNRQSSDSQPFPDSSEHRCPLMQQFPQAADCKGIINNTYSNLLLWCLGASGKCLRANLLSGKSSTLFCLLYINTLTCIAFRLGKSRCYAISRPQTRSLFFPISSLFTLGTKQLFIKQFTFHRCSVALTNWSEMYSGKDWKRMLPGCRLLEHTALPETCQLIALLDFPRLWLLVWFASSQSSGLRFNF